MKSPNYDLVLEEYIGSTEAHRQVLIKRYPKYATDLRANIVVIDQLEAVANTSKASKQQLHTVLSQLSSHQPNQEVEITNEASNSWLRSQSWSLAFGGVAVFVLVFGSVLVFQMRPATTENTPATVVANGTIANTISQIDTNTRAEQTQAIVDDQPTAQLDSQINLAGQYQTSLGELYNAVAQ